MARRRTVDLLPEIFRTETNQQFLAATLDQLTQEPVLTRTQGYVGRRVGPGVNPADNYVVEPTEARSDYQLEPAVTFFRPGTTQVEDAITYPGMIDALALQGADVDRQDRLFQSEYYTWDPFCDLDKFVNYSQYYWLPGGPDSVDVGTTAVPITDDFVVTGAFTTPIAYDVDPYDSTPYDSVTYSPTDFYNFTGYAEPNPVITLVRGGTYRFIINQGSGFWIQSAPGITGTVPGSPNISSRSVLGVENNGITQGVVTFNVPLKSAQDFFYNLADAGTVDLVTPTVKFNEINNVYLGDPNNPAPGTFFARYPNGIDGTTNLNGRTIIFTNTIENIEAGGWQITSQFDPLAQLPSNNGVEGSYDTTLFDQTTDITDQADRYAIYRIDYQTDDSGNQFMTLTRVTQVSNLSKLRVLFGTQYSNTQWYKTATGFWQQMPLLTAVLDDLWYQDSRNAEIFGRIRLIDANIEQPLDINEIIGAQNYTSPNGVVFTNGLKVQFRGDTLPPEYKDQEYYVEGVGTGPGINFRAGFVDGEAYFGPWHLWQNQRVTGVSHREDVFQQYIYHTIEESLENFGQGPQQSQVLPAEPVPLQSVLNGIRLVPARLLVTPETYTKSATIPYDSTPYDATPYDAALNAPEVPDYLTVNRASRDLNAWSRSNRWFHVDVIRYAAELNNQIPVIDDCRRAKRPIIEFRPNLELWNFGTQGKTPVNIVDFAETDAFSNINGQLGYSVDGYSLINGSRVIFARDRDLEVRNRIYQVEFIDPDGDPNSAKIINLTPTPDATVFVNQTVVSLSGNTQQGISYWFDGVDWRQAQQKTGVNQAPLFNVRDINGVSLGDREVYPSTTFAGSRLFGYAEGGTQRTDEVLGLSLKFLNIQNVGDILFDNYFYTDTFLYVRDSISQTEPISQGFVRQYVDRTLFTNLIGWQTAAEENRSRQVFRFVFDGSPLILDVPVDQSSVFAPIQLFQGTEFLDPTRYVYTVEDSVTTITLTDPPATGTVIEVQVISDQASSVGFYQVPLNLESNPLNENSGAFTLGTIRTHYQSIGQNLRDIQGPIDGANNTRDLGDILRFGSTIVQHSSPLSLAGVFLRRRQYEVISAIEFNSREYQKYKAQLIDAASRGDFVNLTATKILDDAIEEIALGRTDSSPFYWSDMLPAGDDYIQTVYTFTDISTNTFDTVQTYDYTSSNFQGMLVYVNDQIQTRGYDYIAGSDAPTITFLKNLAIGDQIVIREFSATYANFVPNTPTKMGLYPAFRPEIFLDTSYLEPVPVIRGHDGSITVAYGDKRDDVLLEFETRIFNNIKITSPIPLTAAEVIPGQWRVTDYTLNDVNQILSTDFLSWVGWNKLDYASQLFVNGDPFTYNYSQSSNKLDQEPLLGAWRGIYLNLYDTTAPNTRPWEMLGFSQEPDWWQQEYGPAPYTEGNWVLWHDLAQGLVKDPAGEYVLPQYARPDLITNVVDSITVIDGGSGYDSQTVITISEPTPGPYAESAALGSPVIVNGIIISIPILNPGKGYTEPPVITVFSGSGSGAVVTSAIKTIPFVVPAGSEGELLPPLDVVVSNFTPTSFRRSWTFGDDGPTENAWRTSSAWPFAVMRLLALTRPAKFFGLFSDRDRYVFDDAIGQYLWDDRYRLDAKQIAPIYGDGVSKASYINWIVDFNRQLGVNSTQLLEQSLDNIGVRLCWRMSSFSDKKFLKVFTERSTPNSLNASLLLPDESYSLLLYKNQPFEQITYSSVIIQRVETGYQVLGYSQTKPYFEILASRPTGLTTTLQAAGVTARVALEHSDTVARVPYGYVFTNVTAVCDFLISYGVLLSRQGFVFESRENGYILDWPQMAQEFLYWTTQGWAPGSMINLNPGAVRISVTRPGTVVEDLSTPRPENLILNQNRQVLPTKSLVIERLDNTFRLTSLTADTINYLNLQFTAYEHLMVLDNTSIFADLIYDPVTGARQNRVLVSGYLSGDWNGTVNAPGFVLNEDNIREWIPNRQYSKGEIVLFKDDYWAAAEIIQPSVEFDYQLWIRTDYDQIQKGLLSNAAASSDQLAQAYSVYNTNLEQEVNLFSYGLIGFRPRDYMQALNIDDVSQVNLYQQFLGTKGTRRSAELFTFADLGKESAQYDVYEYWSILRSQYGATANRNYFEILLDATRLRSDPSLVQIIQPQQPSQADQTVQLKNLWKTSQPLTSTDILPSRVVPSAQTALPSAGYVNFGDVEFTAFTLDNLESPDINELALGDNIWVAKSNRYDWNVYRTVLVPGDVVSVADNLDGRSVVTFTKQHGLTTNDWIIIRFFGAAVDGAYQVRGVPSLNSVLIDFSFVGDVTELVGIGVAFAIQSARVNQPSDAVTLEYARRLTPGAKIWVDDDGSGHWVVLEKTDPFRFGQPVLADTPVSDSGFGSAVSQGLQNLSCLVGAPGEGTGGSVYAFVKNFQDSYQQSARLDLSGVTGAGAFGSSIDIGDQAWAVAGAPGSASDQGYAVTIFSPPGSGAFVPSQVLVDPLGDPGDEFGRSVTVSQDERWIYVGAPGANRVYAYTRVDVENQSVTYITDGATGTYSFDGSIIVDQPEQLQVILGQNALVYLGSGPSGFVVAGNDVILNSIPVQGQRLTISRRNGLQLEGNSSIDTYSVAELYTAIDIHAFTVYVNEVIQVPGVNYSFDANTRDIIFDSMSVPATGSAIRVAASSYFTPVAVIDGATDLPTPAAAGARFGASVTTTTDGSTLIVGAPKEEITGNVTGASYLFDRRVQRFSVTNAAVSTYTTVDDIEPLTAPVSVRLNSVYLANGFGSVNNQVARSGAKSITISASLQVGDIIEVDVNAFTFTQKLTDIDYFVDNVEIINGGSGYKNSPTVTISAPPGGTSSVTATIKSVIIINGSIVSINIDNPGRGYNPISPPAITISGGGGTGASAIAQLKSNIATGQASLNSDFGAVVDQCVNDCSLYVSAPNFSGQYQESGHVVFFQNQSRVYGTITSPVANRVLTELDWIRVNNYFVRLPQIPAWNGALSYTVNAFVQDSGSIFQALAPITAGTALTDITKWRAVTWETVLAQAINTTNNGVGVPNAQATVDPDLVIIAPGDQKQFTVGQRFANSITLVYVNNVRQTLGVNYDFDGDDIVFGFPPAAESEIRLISTRLTVSVKNAESAAALNKVTVLPGPNGATKLPGDPTMFEDLGFETYAYTQTIESPVPQDYAHFGASLFISDSTQDLIVGAPDGTAIESTTFDDGATQFDAGSTEFFDPVPRSGVVYSYDLFPAANASVANPDQWLFGQQIYITDLAPGDQFGASVDYTTGTLLIGVPGQEFSDSTLNIGTVAQFRNPSRTPAWQTIRRQQPIVDVYQLNSIFIYDVVAGQARQYFDYIDPLQGKILGAARQNIDYITPTDPAAYNAGTVNNYGQRWAQEHVGEIWWDTNNTRFIDPNQDDITYASRRWSQLFPGSTVDVYQWVSSTVPPAQYAGPGQARSRDSYVVTSGINEQGIFNTTYFFWVTGIDTVARDAGKTLSAENVRRYIENPRSSGIAYVAAVNSSTVALYNALPYIQSQDSVLHIEYDRELNDDVVHVEYQLIPQDRGDGFLDAQLYRKLLDSFCGADTVGNLVPDPFLPESERYGVAFRPRQSLFANRFLALENYLTEANRVLALYPMTEIRSFDLLKSQDPEPPASSNLWNQRVLDDAELSYQNLAAVPVQSIQSVTWVGTAASTITITSPLLVTAGQLVTGRSIPPNTFVGSVTTGGAVTLVNSTGDPVDTQGASDELTTVTFAGYRYLVASDAANRGNWTIYEVVPGSLPGSRTLLLTQVQNYNTNLYWRYQDWYRVGYNPLTRLAAEVPNVSALETITLPEGSAVKVTANAQGNFEIYLQEAGEWMRVGLQNGTIQIAPTIWNYSIERYGFDVEVFDAQYFDQEPVTETRRILQSLNQEIFIDDLDIERNRLLILMFNFILSEQIAPTWLTKTSLIDVDHVVRRLEPFQIYRQDNQDFVLNYIQEVKPYHTQIRNFNLIYQGSDVYDGTVTDFDVPAYWDASQSRFISPVLDNIGTLSTTSSVPSTSPVWQELPWSQWFDNYKLSVESAAVIVPGAGYLTPPEVIVTGECDRPAEFSVRINSAGQVASITVINPGEGYLTTATIELVGGLPEAVPWQGSTAVPSGLVIQTPAGDVYTVITSGVLASVPPLETTNTVISGTAILSYVGTRARAVARMGNPLVRSFTTTLRYDRYEYRSAIQQWQSGVVYTSGDRVRYSDQVWQAIGTPSTAVFDLTEWQRVPAGDLSGVDRTMGYYAPTADQPGLDLALLITGVDYPGVQVQGVRFNQNTGFDVGNYDINPFDNISFGAEGRPTYDPAILDAIYESEFDDPFLGVLPAPAYGGAPVDTRPGAIEVNGGAFVDTYSSHAPEELVPGAVFDTLDFRVFSSPGADWSGNGHGFSITSRRYINGSNILYFGDLGEDFATIRVWNATAGIQLTPDVHYTVDWQTFTVTILSGAAAGDLINITTYGVGGGNQLFKQKYRGNEFDAIDVSTKDLAISFDSIASMSVTIGSINIKDFAIKDIGSGNTRLILGREVTSGSITVQVFDSTGSEIFNDTYPATELITRTVSSIAVPITFNLVTLAVSAINGQVTQQVIFKNGDGAKTLCIFTDEYTNLDYLLLTLLGDPINGDHTWSAPLTQYLVYDGIGLTFALTNSVAGTNPANIVVEVNGRRARPAAGKDYLGDGSTVSFDLPTRGDYSPSAVADNEVAVYVDNLPLTLGVNYVVDSWDGSSDRTVTLTTAPAAGAQILISVNTNADYFFSSNTVIWRNTADLIPILGDVVSFTTWNDTAEQDIVTLVFSGSTDNRFDVGRQISSADRIMVTVNGFYKFSGIDFVADQTFTVEGTEVVIPGAPISAADVVVITVFTNSVVPGPIAFRIFQDMRGLQLAYRITPETTTTLQQDLSATADTIYVVDADRLPAPNLEVGIFGQITINGERITYRVRDTVNNTLTGLRRGTAGTGAADHVAGSAVYSISPGELLPEQYQNRIVETSILANGIQTFFASDNIFLTYGALEPYDTTPYSTGDIDFEPGSYAYGETNPEEFVEVYVGGERVTQGFVVSGTNPAAVNFDVPPPPGVEVTILVRRGRSWYLPDSDLALQRQPTDAARFIRD